MMNVKDVKVLELLKVKQKLKFLQKKVFQMVIVLKYMERVIKK